MKTLSLLLFLAALPVFAQTLDPATVLFDTGTQDEATGRLDRAKITLLTLASTYTADPLAAKARVEIGAIYMFKEAQAQVKNGDTRTGFQTYRTLMRVYPDSPLAKLADETSKSLGIPPDPRN